MLFPLDEDKSMNLLDQIMAKSNGKLDPEIKTRDLFSLVKEEEKKIGFHYLLNRLAYLHDRAAEAPPKSKIGRLFHRCTHRHMMMLTVVGIFAAFVLGVISLVTLYSVQQTNVAKETLELQREANCRGV